MTYSIIKESTMWSTDSLKQKVEKILNEKTKDGYEVVTVAFGLNMWRSEERRVGKECRL